MRRFFLAALLSFGAVAGFASAAHSLGGRAHGAASWAHGCPTHEADGGAQPGGAG